MFYVLVEKKPGLAARISKQLFLSSYSNVRFKPLPKIKILRDDIILSCLRFTFDGGQKQLSERTEKALLGIKGCEEVLYKEPTGTSVESGSSVEPEKKDLVAIKTKKIVVRDDDLQKLKVVALDVAKNPKSLPNYIETLAVKIQRKEVLDKYLYQLGYEVGHTVYMTGYQFGKPLELKGMIKYSLVLALNQFGHATCTKDSVSVHDNELCKSKGIAGHCSITKGFISGFLDGNCKTINTVVETCNCSIQGALTCSFKLNRN